MSTQIPLFTHIYKHILGDFSPWLCGYALKRTRLWTYGKIIRERSFFNNIRKNLR